MRSAGIEQHVITIDTWHGERSSGCGARIRRQISRALVGAGVLIGAVAMAIWLGVVVGVGGDDLLAGSSDQLGYVEVVVRQGDTLWSLAQKHGPQHRDIRETIDRIRRLNGLESRASIRPGERLTIPTR